MFATMLLARARSLQARLLPHGVLDVVRQVLLFAAAYYAYRLVRGWIDDPQGATVAFSNARHLIHFEQTLGFFVEPSVQAWASTKPAIIDFASWVYLNCQTSVTLGALVFLYLFHNKSFYFVRNMFMVAMGIALVGYTVMPTAPPRFFPEWGFLDSVSDFTGVSHDSVGGQRALQPLRGGPVDARVLRADDRRHAGAAVQAPRHAHRLGSVPAARDLRDRRHRQPLPLRRDPRRRHGRPVRLRPPAGWPARARPPGPSAPHKA